MADTVEGVTQKIAEIEEKVNKVEGNIERVLAKDDPDRQELVLLQQVQVALRQELVELRKEKNRLAEGVAGAAGAAGVAGPHEIRQRFITYLKESNINRPNEEVLNRLERYFPAHLIACSSAANALNLYADAKALPGSSTKAHLLTQLGLRVNGPYFVKGDGPVSLLQASTSYGRPSVLKLLERQHPASHGLYGEAKAVQALYDGKPTSVALASCEVLELHLSEEHEGTGHAPGMYRALLMPCYITSVARALPLSPSVLAAQGRKMAEALEWIHNKGWVHMDVKGDNIFIDSDGRWWLGDFGSAVQQGEPIKSTTQWFMPCKWVCGKNVADPKYDWHMLTVALLCELHKDTWKEVLIEDGYAPLHKLEAAISGTPVTADTADLVAFLNDLLKRSSS